MKFRPTKEHFALLKAQSHERMMAMAVKYAAELGCTVEHVLKQMSCACCTGACYCACPKGPCEHVWNGPEWASDDECSMSTTCSNCGSVAMYHDLRTAEF